MSVQDDMRIIQIFTRPLFRKDGPEDIVGTVHVMIQIIIIRGTLQNRIVYSKVWDTDPANDIRVHLFKSVPVNPVPVLWDILGLLFR